MVIAKVPCVLVMKADVLIKRAFASLLKLGCEFEVAVSDALDVSELAEDVVKLHPDVVFLSGFLPLANKDYLSQLLIHHPGLKVVVASNESNWLHIFKHEDQLLTSIEDLWAIINSS